MSDEDNAGTPAENAGAADAASKSGPDSPKGNSRWSKMRASKWFVPGVVIVVIVVIIAGGLAWHDTPAFCGQVCHESMQPYVDTYNSDNKGMMAVVHREAGDNCLSCHNPKVTEQVRELTIEVEGSWPSDETGHLALDSNLASEEFCTKGGCHDMNEVRTSVVLYADGDQTQTPYYPHASHQDGALQCGDCHKSHKTSVLVCNQCHALNVPEGWEVPGGNK